MFKTVWRVSSVACEATSVVDDQLTPVGHGGNQATTEGSGQGQQLPETLLQEGADRFHGVQSWAKRGPVHRLDIAVVGVGLCGALSC